MLAAAGNNAVSEADPKDYLPLCARKLGKSADTVFTSNLLPLPSQFDYSKAEYESFLEERAKIVTEFVNGLCDGDISWGIYSIVNWP